MMLLRLLFLIVILEVIGTLGRRRQPAKEPRRFMAERLRLPQLNQQNHTKTHQWFSLKGSMSADVVPDFDVPNSWEGFTAFGPAEDAGDYNEIKTSFDGADYVMCIPQIKALSDEISLRMFIYRVPDDAKMISSELRFGSQVLSLEVFNETETKVTDFSEAPINITFPVVGRLGTEVPICSFQSDDDYPYWYTDGCVANFVGDNVTCTCDHLTHFAVLLQVQRVAEEDTFALNLLTRIGLGLSIACLAVTLVVYAFCRLTSTRILTHANLAVSLLASHVTFLFIDTKTQAACTAVAILLHFFLLTAFIWMALEGVFLYIRSTPTFPWTIRRPVWFLIGWGLPAGLVVISVAVRHSDYVEFDRCWLSFDGGLVWAFLAPVLLILAGNAVMLIRLIWIFLSLKSNRDKPDAARLKAGLRVVVVLEPLLGLPWILNLFYVSPSTIFFAYVAVILNPLQGVFVFLAQCLFDKEVKEAFRAKTSRVQLIHIVPEAPGATA